MSLAAHECNHSQEQLDETDVIQESNHRRTGVKSRLQQVTRRGIRKARQRGQSKESPQSEETNKTGDNVPTIEIIVMPVPVSLEQHAVSEGSSCAGGSGNERGGVYRVVFPAESKLQTVFHAQDEAALSQCNQQQDQEVPVASTTL